MTSAPTKATTGWELAERTAAICAVAPIALGGCVVRAGPGPVRDAWVDLFVSLLPEGAPIVRLPMNVGPERLLGDIDIAATLARRAVVPQRGLLTAAHGGAIILPSAEQVETQVANGICSCVDTGILRVENDGFSAVQPARFSIVAFDESHEEQGGIAQALSDRLAFGIDLSTISYRDLRGVLVDRAWIATARRQFDRVTYDERVAAAICEATISVGIRSGRVDLLVLRCACAIAALEGRTSVSDSDTVEAASLVLGHRGITLPPPQQEEAREEAPDEQADDRPPSPTEQQSSDLDEQASKLDQSDLAELIVDSVRHQSIDRTLLDYAQRGPRTPPKSMAAGRGPTRQIGKVRGKPSGVRRLSASDGGRINLLATLRAAAPWQRIRRDALARQGPLKARSAALIVHRDDLRATRYEQSPGSTILFLVDASGSTALGRLAEAKGAVEMSLSESYKRRDQVALISFRGTQAELNLTPTRSLVRAKKALAALPGGGATPLATGLQRAFAVGRTVEAEGRLPVLVLITDGRPNIDMAGQPDRAAAKSDALKIASRISMQNWAALVFDASTRPTEQTRELAQTLGAEYRHLPYITSQTVADAVKSTMREIAKVP